MALIRQGEVSGMVLRTEKKTNPVHTSPGHRILMEQRLYIIRQCVAGYRIPEPTRRAHLWVNEVRIAAGTEPSCAPFSPCQTTCVFCKKQGLHKSLLGPPIGVDHNGFPFVNE